MIVTMLKAVASTLAAAAVGISAAAAVAQPAPKPAATPFAIGSFQPQAVPEPPAVPLQDIGRTRSVTPACAAMRDLIVPSFAAAVRADKRFTDTRKRLPSYVEIADDPEHRTDVFRQMMLSKLDADASTLLQEAKVLNDALGDARLSADTKDPQVAEERRALQTLYVAQMTRANLLNEFVMRERFAVAKDGLGDASPFAPRGLTPKTASQLRTPTNPIPTATAAPGMPSRSGITMADKNAIDDWGSSISTYVRTNENEAARTFLPIAKTCR